MGVRFTVLASGSSGNAAFLQVDGFGLLIDVGLGSRQLASRLQAIGATWNHVHAVLLTHTHSDHWKDRSFAQMRNLKIPLYCHTKHHQVLEYYSPSFPALKKANLVHPYGQSDAFTLGTNITCLPIWVPHDSDPTFAFHLEGSPGLFGPTWSIGYASDLGCATHELVERFSGVNLLAIEFNHDEEMEKRSRRPKHLIERVLSDRGHLSNYQARDIVHQILSQSEGKTFHHLVQLHLSRECNKPSLALSEGKEALKRSGVVAQIITATQDIVTRTIELDPIAKTKKSRAS
jgi:phosphoribosyl 1,2-cyclic phosphodiesterase